MLKLNLEKLVQFLTAQQKQWILSIKAKWWPARPEQASVERYFVNLVEQSSGSKTSGAYRTLTSYDTSKITITRHIKVVRNDTLQIG